MNRKFFPTLLIRARAKIGKHPFKPLEKLETYTIDKESYHVFRARREGESLIIDFIWGKTDFRQCLSREKGKWVNLQLFLIKNSKYYRYVQIAEHGVTYDEFLWRSQDGEELFIELPKDFADKADQVARLVIESRGWGS